MSFEITELDAGLRSRKRTRPILYMVIHHTATSSPEATQRVLRARGLSTHLEIGPDGRIWQYLDPITRVGFHARAWNAHGIGVDLTGPPGRDDSQPVLPYPDAQVQALAWLVSHLVERFALPSLMPYTVRPWKRDPWLHARGDRLGVRYSIVPHSAIQKGKVDPSDWRLDGTAWDMVLRPAIIAWPGATTENKGGEA